MDFPVVLRGYDRQAVDDYVAEIAQLVAELESTQLRESVVQRALDEVGEQTSGILQRAHEAAEEIAARSRAQAEGRIQRAEREAEIVRREADQYSEQVIVDTKRLWEERQRLVEEIRQLADEVLATADDALERVKEPELLRREREAAERQADPPAAILQPVRDPLDARDEQEHPLDSALLDEGPAVVEREPVAGGGEEDELERLSAGEEDELERLSGGEEDELERLSGGEEDELEGLTGGEEDELEDDEPVGDDDDEPAAEGEAGEASEGGDEPTAEFRPPLPPDRPDPAA